MTVSSLLQLKYQMPTSNRMQTLTCKPSNCRDTVSHTNLSPVLYLPPHALLSLHFQLPTSNFQVPSPHRRLKAASRKYGRSTTDKAEDEEIYEKLLERNPRNVEVLKVLLTVKMKKGKSKEAVTYVERLIEIEPNEVEWRLLQALCYEMMGQLSKSKRLFKEILMFKEILKKRPLLLRALHNC